LGYFDDIVPLGENGLVFGLRGTHIQGDQFATMADLLPVLNAADAGELEGFQEGFEGEGLFGFMMRYEMESCLILFIWV
jgi:hypothetical protein